MGVNTAPRRSAFALALGREDCSAINTADQACPVNPLPP
jgi:hypothetical protein